MAFGRTSFLRGSLIADRQGPEECGAMAFGPTSFLQKRSKKLLSDWAFPSVGKPSHCVDDVLKLFLSKGPLPDAAFGNPATPEECAAMAFGPTSFLQKRSKKLLSDWAFPSAGKPSHRAEPKREKVFWSSFSKKDIQPSPKSPTMRLTALTTLLITLSGCTMIPDYHRPSAPVEAGFPNDGPSAASLAQGQAALGDWRSFYRDPLMQKLIAAALENNRDLRVAQAQLDAASAQFDIENAALLPTLDGGALANVQKIYSRTYSLSQSSGAFYLREYAVGFGVSAYEVDLWGRVRSASQAAFDRAAASALSQQSIRLSLIGNVAAAMLAYVADNEALHVTEDVLANRQHTYDLVRHTAAIGTGTALDVAQAETALRDAQTNLAIYTRERERAADQLALLVGAPIDAATKADLAGYTSLARVEAFPDVPAGLPSDMIARRPDILSAEANLRASNDDIGAARAEFFPKIQITAGAGTASNNITRLFQSGMGAWNIAPQITLPIFDAGRLSAQLRAAKAQKRGEIATYEKTIQTAFREVADALAGRATYGDQLSAQTALIAASARQYDLALQRFRGGYDPYLDTLVAQRSLYTARLGGITTRLAALSNSVTLYKALGGGWAITQGKPNPTPPVQKIL